MINFDFMFDPPVGHSAECNCEPCHREHVDTGNVIENASRPDFRCCSDQLDLWIEDGRCCEKKSRDHGQTHMEVLRENGKLIYTGRCLECAGPAPVDPR
jgi:hypothetical protein